MGKFDGIAFFNDSTEEGLPSNTIYGIAEDRQGNIRFATNGGDAYRSRVGNGWFLTVIFKDKR